METINLKIFLPRLRAYVATIDWRLLAFLVLFLNVKTGVKLIAIILIYLLNFHLKMGFAFKQSRLPLFYPMAIGIVVLNWVINTTHTGLNHLVVTLSGIGFWILCILAIHQVKLRVEKSSVEKLHQTILLFFVINTIVSLVIFLGIVAETHALNPYRYQGNYQKYFIGTGDYIKGLTFDVSTTNSVLNAMGVIYFLTRQKILMVLVCMSIMLLTGSNTINFLLIVLLMLLFIFKTTKAQKSTIVICVMFLAVFIFKISPQNDEYIYKTYYKFRYKKLLPEPVINLHPTPLIKKPDSILNADERREKKALLHFDTINRARVSLLTPAVANATTDRPVIPTPSIHTAPFQNRPDTNAERAALIHFVNDNKRELPQASKYTVDFTLPGKAIAFKQTFNYLTNNPSKAILGAGAGNFSSKLAFKATGLGIAGGFPKQFTYIGQAFLVNHLDLYLNYFSRSAGWHSLINSPNSVYDQLLSEYGLIGLLAFGIFYLGYFIKNYKRLTYGITLIGLMCGVFLLDYWFEQLSVIVFFELLMLLNIKENSIKIADYGN